MGWEGTGLVDVPERALRLQLQFVQLRLLLLATGGPSVAAPPPPMALRCSPWANLRPGMGMLYSPRLADTSTLCPPHYGGTCGGGRLPLSLFPLSAGPSPPRGVGAPVGRTAAAGSAALRASARPGAAPPAPHPPPNPLSRSNGGPRGRRGGGGVAWGACPRPPCPAVPPPPPRGRASGAGGGTKIVKQVMCLFVTPTTRPSGRSVGPRGIRIREARTRGDQPANQGTGKAGKFDAAVM